MQLRVKYTLASGVFQHSQQKVTNLLPRADNQILKQAPNSDGLITKALKTNPSPCKFYIF